MISDPVSQRPWNVSSIRRTSLFRVEDRTMGMAINDFGYAARTLRKNAGFTAVAVLTIALGISACTAIFSVVNAVLLRPLPYANAQRLVVVWGELRARNVHDWPFSPPDFRDLRQQSKSFD